MTFRTSSSSFNFYDESSHRRKYALLAALLFHGLVLFLLLQPKDFVLKKPAAGSAEKIVWAEPLSITPPKPVVKRQPSLAINRPPPPKALATPSPKLASKAKPLPSAKLPPAKQVAQKNPLPPQPLPTPAPALPTITTPTPAPAEDMMAQIEANRQRRAQARSAQAENPVQEESEAQRGVRQAQANLANLQAKAQGSGRDEHGGVFKLGSINYHKAEFTFNGWNKNFRRQWPRLVEVQLGNEPDIETAIIKSMMALIRKEREAEFTWDSHRLGRIVELNAKPEFGSELQAFLMREFFPTYRAVARQ